MIPLYKVKLSIERHPSHPLTFDEYYCGIEGPIRWLHDNDRHCHLLNMYENAERGITFVFDDATKATLFRLSH
jgi:hypothetical protein